MTTNVKVTEILGQGVVSEGIAHRVDGEGLTLSETNPTSWPTRYAWLLLHLRPDTAIRVLAERVDDDDAGTVRVRYKHLFPEHRRALQAFLGEVAA